MIFSLIAATRNRPIELKRFLDSLQGQAPARFEVIVVDQSSQAEFDTNKSILTPDRHSFPIMHIRSEAIGLSRARNLGMQHATGQIYAFPDDDCWYREGYLNDIESWFTSHPQYTFLSGQYSEPNIVNPHSLMGHRPLASAASAFHVRSVSLFVQASLITKKHLCFDESIGAGTALPAGEENEFVIRIIRSGGSGYYSSDFITYHAIFRDQANDDDSLNRSEEAYGYVLGKHITCPTIIARAMIGYGRSLIEAFGRNSKVNRWRARSRGIVKGLRTARNSHRAEKAAE